MLKRKIFFSLGLLFVGAVLPLAFAPFGYYWVAEIALILLLLAWGNAKSPEVAFWYGWLFGLAFFGFGVYWIYISVHNYGNAPVVLAVLILALMVGFLALYPAFQGYLLNRIFPQDNWGKLLLVFPASWVILEWIRGWFLSGFPWLLLGYSHIDSPLRGWATVFGVYGVSFVIAQTAGAIVFIFYLFYSRKKNNLIKIKWGVLLIVLLWSLGYCLTKITWISRVNDSIQISLVQGNVSLERKWNINELYSILDSYAYLSAKNFASKIIIWPEAAIPTYPENIASYLRKLSIVARNHNVTILSGIPFYDKKSERYYNGIMVFGANEGRYYKRHLVPFGEYMPLRFILGWLHNYLTIPMSGFSSGAGDQTDLIVGKILVAPFICYEIAYTDLVLEYLPRAGLLVTICDDSWFGESIAAAQHLEIARMRSLEVGRYQLLSTSTGITAVIDFQGRIISQAPMFRQAVLTTKVQPITGSTPWVKYGQRIWLWLLLIALLVVKWKKST